MVVSAFKPHGAWFYIPPSAKLGFGGAAPGLHLWKSGSRGCWLSWSRTAAAKVRNFPFKIREHLWSCATLQYLAGIYGTSQSKTKNHIFKFILIKKRHLKPNKKSMNPLVLPQLSNIICSICFMSLSEEPFTHFDSWTEVRKWYSRKEINI